jgi:hypothetical protein
MPWELMRDPELNSPISLRVKSFVRVQSNPNISFVKVPSSSDGRVRLLYIASRPGGAGDVELRAVANRLVRDLGPDRARFDIKALRPPTFEKLQQELTDAREAGRPFHILHFDGHGTYEDLSKTTLAHWATALSTSDDDARKPGYLLFEHSGEDKVRPIDGETLGKLLHDAGVPVLVLNACQSAMHELKDSKNSKLDVDDEVRAIGSLSQAVVDQGVPAVLGMRYSVFVVTAAQYIGQLYAALAKGRSFGQAATEGRKHLQLNPERWVGLEPHPLQDWFVPVAYEAVPIELLSATQTISLAEQPELDPVQTNRALLRYVPEEGFIGRDETLLALDRAFDNHRVVLLHAYAGQGKSSTAVEFSRWYALTGGLGNHPVVLLASFEGYADLDDLLNQIAQTFSPVLEQQGIHWSALNEPDKRRNVVVQILRHFPIVWIWDNVETVAGFPDGTESQWTIDEQNELHDFLKQIKFDDASQVRILLTSRRDEQKWLGGIPHRIQMPRMRNSDAARLALKLGEEKNLAHSEIADWQPLIDYCAGNPLTLRVLVGQAVGARLRGKRQIADFVEAIRSGEQEIQDADEKEGRDKSLGASLSYGFRNAFRDEELPIIALLHLFQGTVSVAVFEMMERKIQALAELKDKNVEYIQSLLDRANEIGVLSRLGRGYFAIHPALPWFLRQFFGQYYGGGDGIKSSTAVTSWVKAVAVLANHCAEEFHEGNRTITELLAIEEFNVLHARRLALDNKLWELAVDCLRGLQTLYEFQGRWAEWGRLVNEMRVEYCTSDYHPMAGREHLYAVVMGYLVRIAAEHEQDLPRATDLQEKLVKYCRKRAAADMRLPSDEPLKDDQVQRLRNLASSLSHLATLRARTDNPTCLEDYQQAIAIHRRVGNKGGEAITQWNLGNAYRSLQKIRDLDAAELAYLRSIDLLGSNDALGRARCIKQIGRVYYERFAEAMNRHESREVLLGHFNAAQKHFLEALNLCPTESVSDRAAIHNNLGILYSIVGSFKNAREHYEIEAQLEERSGNHHAAGVNRFNMALMYQSLAQDEQQIRQQHDYWERARAYAEAALRDFEFYRGRAARDELDAQELLSEINHALSKLTC